VQAVHNVGMKPPKLSGYALRSLARAWKGRRAVGVLPAKLREQIVLHVSSLNECAVCSSIHGKAAAAVGLEAGEVAAARSLSLDGVDPRTRLAVRYAELRTLDGESGAPEDVAAFEAAYSPEEQAAVRTLVDLFTFNNRFNNTWEGILPGAAARRRKLGIRHE
jgi:AhpD family alkylhydroperoxidase